MFAVMERLCARYIGHHAVNDVVGAANLICRMEETGAED